MMKLVQVTAPSMLDAASATGKRTRRTVYMADSMIVLRQQANDIAGGQVDWHPYGYVSHLMPYMGEAVCWFEIVREAEDAK